MIRLAIIGNGERAARHEAACRQVDGIDVVAVVGPGADFGALFGRGDIAAVDVCAPPGAATRLATDAARAGKRVIMEYRPVAADDLSITELLPERHHPLAKQMKTIVDEGRLGALRYVHAAAIAHWSADDQAARAAWDGAPPNDDAGAFVIEYAAGTLDMVAWLFGDVPIATVFARSCSLAADGSSSRYVNAVLSFADGSQAIVEVGLTSGFPSNIGLQRLALTGMGGSAYFTERDHDVVIGAGGVRPLNDDPADGLVAALTAFQSGDVADGAVSARLAVAAAESLRTGQPVEVGR